jgi:NADH-quinone oxidoreductase subunit M
MVCHGLSTGALFLLVGALQERLGTRDLRRLGGLWPVLPRMGAAFLFFALASLGLPGLGNFVAEFLILLGVFAVSPALASVACGGLVLATVYSLWIMYRVFFGPPREHWRPVDLRPAETLAVAVLIVLLLWLGLAPQALLNLSASALNHLPGQSLTQWARVWDSPEFAQTEAINRFPTTAPRGEVRPDDRL